MFRTIDDFLSVWKDEAKSTSKLLAVLTDASLEQAVSNDHRTIGRLAWHITQTIAEMGGNVGLKFKGPHEKDPVPRTAKAIREAYTDAASSLPGAVVAARWTDAMLKEEREMYGENWTVAFALRALMFHQAHHRGQLTVLMRQAGLTVPGIYGPAKEDWAGFGMPAPEI
jgi:uncharacterized damage-inducible protein DinB